MVVNSGQWESVSCPAGPLFNRFSVQICAQTHGSFFVKKQVLRVNAERWSGCIDVVHIQHEHLAEDGVHGCHLMLQSYKNHLLADQISGIPGRPPFEGATGTLEQ